MIADVVSVAAVLVAGVLTGNELGTWAVVHPAVQRLPLPEERAAEQSITRRYGTFMPTLMIATIALAFAASGVLDDDALVLTLGAAGAFCAMLAITLVGNLPLNHRTLQAGADTDNAEWRAILWRWDRLHSVRIFLDAGGFGVLTTALALA